MSLDTRELVRAVKRAAVEAVRAEAPMTVCYGTVASASPLRIKVEQKKTLGETQLILTDGVRDFQVEVSAAGGPEKNGERKEQRVHNALKAGEKVLLLRCDGGQKYIVLGRWEARG